MPNPPVAEPCLAISTDPDKRIHRIRYVKKGTTEAYCGFFTPERFDVRMTRETLDVSCRRCQILYAKAHSRDPVLSPEQT